MVWSWVKLLRLGRPIRPGSCQRGKSFCFFVILLQREREPSGRQGADSNRLFCLSFPCSWPRNVVAWSRSWTSNKETWAHLLQKYFFWKTWHKWSTCGYQYTSTKYWPLGRKSMSQECPLPPPPQKKIHTLKYSVLNHSYRVHMIPMYSVRVEFGREFFLPHVLSGAQGWYSPFFFSSVTLQSTFETVIYQ